MNKKLDYYSLNKLIIRALGFDISSSDIIDQETLQPLKIRDRLVKYSGGSTTIIHKGEVLFNPIEDRRQTQDLFSLFLKKEDEYDNLYVSMYRDESDTYEKTCLIMNTNKGEYKSEYFYNDTLKYIHSMLIITGNDDIDLHVYDNSIS